MKKNLQNLISKAVIILLFIIMMTKNGLNSVGAASSPTLNESEYTLNVGDSVTLRVYNIPTNYKVTWKTLNSKIATVSGTGKVKAVSDGDVVINCILKKGSKKIILESEISCINSASGTKVVHTEKTLAKEMKTKKADTILFKTNKAVNVSVDSMDCSKTALIVDAPNAKFKNKALWKEIEVQNVHPQGWEESSVSGNNITVSTDKLILKCSKSAIIEDLKVNAKVFKLINFGSINAVAIGSRNTITIENNAEISKVEFLGEEIDADYCGSSTSKPECVITSGISNSSLHVYAPLKIILDDATSFTVNNYTDESTVISKSGELLHLKPKSTFTFNN